MTAIMSNCYSSRLKTTTVSYDSLRTGCKIFELLMKVQKDLVLYDRICKSIDMKKMQETSLLENTEKIYRGVLKILQGKTSTDTSFSCKKLISAGNLMLFEKLEECNKYMECMSLNIKMLLEGFRKQHPLYYQLTDNELLSVIVSSVNSLNNHINTAAHGHSQGSVVEYLICNKFLPHTVK